MPPHADPGWGARPRVRVHPPTHSPVADRWGTGEGEKLGCLQPDEAMLQERKPPPPPWGVGVGVRVRVGVGGSLLFSVI